MAINIARRDFMASLGSAAAAWPLAARAQQAAKSYRVAYLVLLGDQDALIVKQRLDELGYTEGKNLISTSDRLMDNWSACLNWPPNSSKPSRT